MGVVGAGVGPVSQETSISNPSCFSIGCRAMRASPPSRDEEGVHAACTIRIVGECHSIPYFQEAAFRDGDREGYGHVSHRI